MIEDLSCCICCEYVSSGIPQGLGLGALLAITYVYCCEFWPVRRTIGHVARIATASPTGTDNSVVTLLELPPRS